jgi:hypothetical protein
MLLAGPGDGGGAVTARGQYAVAHGLGKPAEASGTRKGIFQLVSTVPLARAVG